jgi:ADP-ribosylglycohydrolase
MLIGSLIGDALGGPIEFLPPNEVSSIMPVARSWKADQVVDGSTRKRLAESLQMHSYSELRPDTAAYGPWIASAPRGTITDDSRHKIILLRSLRRMLAENRSRITQQDLARQFVEFQPCEDRTPDTQLAALVNEGLREYRYAAHWILGERNLTKALPVERLWSGIANCSGQMVLLPLAAVFPGDPESAYRETYAIDFVDAPVARDIAAAINAGLAAALNPELDAATTLQRWEKLVESIRATDPYRLRDVPFAGRPLDGWLDLADSIVKRSKGRPARAYELLESEGKPIYYWDAHFTLLVPLTMLKLCEFDPLAAMHLTLDFGHDTDSYAQVLGAMAGAVHGVDIFSVSMRTDVQTRFFADYGESIDQWVKTLTAAARVWSKPPAQ